MTEITKKTTTRKKTSASASAPTSIASKRKASSKNEAPTASVSAEEIARLAHRFWAERGFQHGHDAEDWLRAEQALRGKAS
jgi:hypothetical protein